MPASLGFFRAEGRPKAIDLAERHRGRLVIKLAGLRQIRLGVFEIVHFEQRGSALTRGGRKDRCIHQREAVRVEIVANRSDYFMADAQDRMLALAAQPEMPMVHQEVDAVFLGSNRIRV